MTTTLEERPAYRVGAARPPAPAAVVSWRRLLRALPWQICLITVVGAALRIAHVAQVSPNQFYDAAVRSMSMSWHNFFFGAFDPSAILSIDKPPLDLWLQVVSVKLFGWGQFALRLPEVLGGTLAVPLLYDAVRRVVGRPAALGAAAALAVLPESVLTSRSDTMDSLMMLFVIAALWLTIRAAAGGGRRPLVLAAVALGLAFNVKLLEALVAVPALALLYMLARSGERRQKLVDLAAGGGTLVLVSLSWVTVASLAPGRTPWPVGSSDGSVWNAVFVFNGLAKASQTASTKPGGPGPFRLLVSTAWQYDVLFGCVLLAAVAVGVAALLSRRGGPLSDRAPSRHGVGGSVSLANAFAIALAVWIASALILFDAMATLHSRYLEAVAPAVAAALGYGAAKLAGLTSPDERPSIAAPLLAIAAVCAYTLHFKPHAIGTGTCALLLAVAGATLVARAEVQRRLAQAAKWLLAGLIVGAALVFPVHETAAILRTNANDSLGLATARPENIAALSRYLPKRTMTVRYELAADEPLSLAGLIIRDRRPILPLTSFGGRPLTSVEQLRAAIRAGSVRYGLVHAYGCGPRHAGQAGCRPAALWIRQYGVDVTAEAGLVGQLRLFLLTPDRAG